MPAPSVTYTFSNSTTADATQVNQNFTDLVNGISDGTKDLSISALTCAGNVNLNGNTTIGNASGDTLTVTGSLASHLNPSAHNTYDFGTVTTLGYRYFYFASSSATKTARVGGPAISSDITLTLPSVTAGLGANMSKTTIQRFTSSSGTYTTPTGCVAIVVSMVGAGGGGGGSSDNLSGGTGGTGGDSTFGSSLLTAAGGTGGNGTSGASGTGGAATVNSPAVIRIAATGGSGQGSSYTSLGPTDHTCGGNGAASALGGGGGGAAFPGTGVGYAGATNTGGGGGGASAPNANGKTGPGGGSGAYIEALITSPSATYAYAVGAAGTAGTAGTNGFAGGAGGSGMIVVEEFY